MVKIRVTNEDYYEIFNDGKLIWSMHYLPNNETTLCKFLILLGQEVEIERIQEK